MCGLAEMRFSKHILDAVNVVPVTWLTTNSVHAEAY